MMDISKTKRKSNYELYGDAADEIERLQARVEQLEGKIDDPSWLDFMEISDNFLAHYPPDIFTGESGDSGPLFIVALRNAKQALNP